MKREDFLARVRQAVRAGNGYRPHVRSDLTEATGYVGGGDDRPARMAEELIAVGGHAELTDDLPSARERVSAFLDHWQPRSVLAWRHPLLEQMGLAELLAARDIRQLDYDSLAELAPDEQRAQALAAGVGITSATFGIAETGSLVMAHQPGRERIASLLPPVHLAIVGESQILPDLFDLYSLLNDDLASGRSLPSNITLITGPSKTGDIELQLTTGVHGPGTVHAVLVRGV